MSTYSGPYEGNGMFKSFTKTWHTKPYAQISPYRPELQYSGKIVFITGGGTGIGKATAIAFAQAGAKAVAIFGRRKHKLEEAASEIRAAATDSNFQAIIESVDLSKGEDTKGAFASALKQSGGAKIDVYISNAATASQFGKLAGYQEAELRQNLELNTIGTFNALQAALPLLAPDAKVIDVNSGIGHVRSFGPVWLYAAIKAMNIKMFQYLQAEHPELSVFSLQPGVIETDINIASGNASQDEPELPAQFSVWLASPEATFLKGKFVWCNWDVEELMQLGEEIKASTLLEVNLNGVPM